MARKSDLWALHWLRALAGWNQSLRFWMLVIDSSSAEVLVASRGSTIVGSAMLWCYGGKLDWLGMVIVHPAFRGRGIGRQLLERCLERSSNRGVKSIGLDATDAGRPLYRSLGFQEGERLDRWQVQDPLLVDGPASGLIQAPQPGMGAMGHRVWESGFDLQSFGVDREILCRGLLKDTIASVVLEDRGDKVKGFGLLRHGARSSYLGPLVAESKQAGESMGCELLSHARGRSVLWDVPRANLTARACAERWGFRVQRSFVRMWKGVRVEPSRADRIWGIADPALG